MPEFKNPFRILYYKIFPDGAESYNGNRDLKQMTEKSKIRNIQNSIESIAKKSIDDVLHSLDSESKNDAAERMLNYIVTAKKIPNRKSSRRFELISDQELREIGATFNESLNMTNMEFAKKVLEQALKVADELRLSAQKTMNEDRKGNNKIEFQDYMEKAIEQSDYSRIKEIVQRAQARANSLSSDIFQAGNKSALQNLYERVQTFLLESLPERFSSTNPNISRDVIGDRVKAATPVEKDKKPRERAKKIKNNEGKKEGNKRSVAERVEFERGLREEASQKLLDAITNNVFNNVPKEEIVEASFQSLISEKLPNEKILKKRLGLTSEESEKEITNRMGAMHQMHNIILSATRARLAHTNEESELHQKATEILNELESRISSHFTEQVITVREQKATVAHESNEQTTKEDKESNKPKKASNKKKTEKKIKKSDISAPIEGSLKKISDGIEVAQDALEYHKASSDVEVAVAYHASSDSTTEEVAMPIAKEFRVEAMDAFYEILRRYSIGSATTKDHTDPESIYEKIGAHPSDNVFEMDEEIYSTIDELQERKCAVSGYTTIDELSDEFNEPLYATIDGPQGESRYEAPTFYGLEGEYGIDKNTIEFKEKVLSAKKEPIYAQPDVSHKLNKTAKVVGVDVSLSLTESPRTFVYDGNRRTNSPHSEAGSLNESKDSGIGIGSPIGSSNESVDSGVVMDGESHGSIIGGFGPGDCRQIQKIKEDLGGGLHAAGSQPTLDAEEASKQHGLMQKQQARGL